MPRGPIFWPAGLCVGGLYLFVQARQRGVEQGMESALVTEQYERIAQASALQEAAGVFDRGFLEEPRHREG